MNPLRVEPEFNEPERYELHEPPRYHFHVSRREFVQLLGAGLVISVAVPAAMAQRARGGRSVPLDQRLHIGADGIITVFTSKVEVGQGSRTQLTQAAAEELRVPVETIRFVMADSDLVPDDGGTAGSRTTPSTVPAIRRGCAAARELLVQAAARRFKADAARLRVRDGKVEGLGEGRQFGYADLARGGREEQLSGDVPADVTLTPVDEWQVLGRPVPKVDGREIVTGRHRYPSDIVRDGMLFGKVLRPPSYGAELSGIDLRAVSRVEGAVACRDGNFVGVAAPNSHLAELARRALAETARWKEREESPSSAGLYDHLRRHANSPRRNGRGDVEKAFSEAARVLRETYHIPYIQHAPMEPRAAVAEWNDGKLTVWTGTQQPSRVHGELTRAFRLAPDNVRVIVPDTGGGFGGKHTGDAAVEAARLALESGRPVSLRWTREEEFTWAYFRPAGVIDVAGSLDAANRLTGWRQVNFNSGGSALESPYDAPNQETEFRSCDQPLRSGSYRALASTANNFARESFMDELAYAAGMNPLEFRLRHLSHARLRPVLEAVAERFGWNAAWRRQEQPARTGIGLACGTEKGSFVATCARIELDLEARRYRITDVCQAFECGAICDPENLKAQVDGCLIQGLGAILSERIDFEKGRILNARFSRYAVPRFRDVPDIETVLLDRKDLTPVGAGETPIIGIAPAVGNALFHAVQVRIRSLPLANEKWRPA